MTHLAPELFQVGSKLTTAVDTFSFGIMMWELYTGQRAYGGLGRDAIIDRVYKKKVCWSGLLGGAGGMGASTLQLMDAVFCPLTENSWSWHWCTGRAYVLQQLLTQHFSLHWPGFMVDSAGHPSGTKAR